MESIYFGVNSSRPRVVRWVESSGYSVHTSTLPCSQPLNAARVQGSYKMPCTPASMTHVHVTHVTRNGVDILPGKLLHTRCDRMSAVEWVQCCLCPPSWFVVELNYVYSKFRRDLILSLICWYCSFSSLLNYWTKSRNILKAVSFRLWATSSVSLVDILQC